jgi:hypothetical protein
MLLYRPMLGLTQGELILFVILVFAVVSARFWPAAGARIAERLGGRFDETDGPSKSQRTNGGEST